MDRTPATGAAPAAPVPVRLLTVLYDPDCSLCSFVRRWLERQRQIVPLELVAAGSDQARSRFPELDHTATLREITVVGDSGQVYQGDVAWLVCLWALAEYRPLSHRLSTRAGAPVARAAVLAAARYREAQWGRTAAAGGWAGRSYTSGGDGAYRPEHGRTHPAPESAGDDCASGCAPPG